MPGGDQTLLILKVHPVLLAGVIRVFLASLCDTEAITEYKYKPANGDDREHIVIHCSFALLEQELISIMYFQLESLSS